jgi:hypothetical protein
VAWAWACDPYYAVYCVMLGGAFVVTMEYLAGQDLSELIQSSEAGPLGPAM